MFCFFCFFLIREICPLNCFQIQKERLKCQQTITQRVKPKQIISRMWYMLIYVVVQMVHRAAGGIMLIISERH